VASRALVTASSVRRLSLAASSWGASRDWQWMRDWGTAGFLNFRTPGFQLLGVEIGHDVSDGSRLGKGFHAGASIGCHVLGRWS
jgi:hypothetical protein